MAEPQIGQLLRRAYFRAQREAMEALAPLGVSPIQAGAIGALLPGPLRQADLGRRLEMEPANVHALVRRMGAAGLVERRPDPDNARRVLVALTPAGLAMSDALQGPRRAAGDATLKALDPEERAALVRLLSRLLD